MKRGLEEEGEQITARNSCRRRAQWPCYLGRERTPLTQHRGGRGALELQTAPPCSDHSHGDSGFWGEDWATSQILISSSSKGVWVHRRRAPSSPFHPTHLPHGSGRQSLHPGARPPTHFGSITNRLCLVTTVSLRSVSSSVKWR